MGRPSPACQASASHPRLWLWLSRHSSSRLLLESNGMDPSSDYYFLNQILWRRVKLTLVCGIFEGVLQHVDPNKIVVLKKVKNVETGRSVPGVKMFFGHEIVNVELLDEVKQDALTEKTSSVSLNAESTRMDGMKNENLNVCEPPSPAPELSTAYLLNDCKYSPSAGEEVTYIVIDQFQQKFSPAMLHIKKQSVLSVATNSRVYLFDIFLLGSRAFNNGLQMVLEDKRILKVMHDCRWLSDCLSHQYGILLNNVFDTQVADVLQFSIETGGFLPNCISTLQESLIRHLKVAPKYLFFLEERQKLIQENPEVWFARPLSPSLLKILALEATYLLPLRLVLLDEMMSDLTTLVDGYLNTYREGSVAQLGGMEPTCMELPEELLQFKDFQKQRRERAAKEYRLNEQGLLIRTVLCPKKSMTEAAGKGGKVRGSLFCRPSRLDKPPHFTSHGNVNLLKEESKSKQTTTESQHVPPVEEETSEISSTNEICSESEGPEDQGTTQKEQLKILKQDLNKLIFERGDRTVIGGRKPGRSKMHKMRRFRVSFPSSGKPSVSKKAVLPIHPPFPALEKTDSWINPSPTLP
ncbi:hypothetical protein MC885_004285 [Smutsia gigantea]|nr:hypothetical protein MC885_004285 [Smutsia gigantea]